MSTKTTSNLNLHSWSPNDQFLLDEIVDNFEKIDSEFSQRGTNIKWFGALANCQGGQNFSDNITGNDDTKSFNLAIQHAIKNGSPLILEPRKRYLITDTLTIDKPIDIIGNGASIIGMILNKNKPVILAKNQNQSKWENFYIIGAGYIPLAGIQFSKPDNQAMILSRIKISTCRHGFYLNEPECVNRIRLDHCHATSNLIAGIWFESFKNNDTYGHSAPFSIIDTICNSNGIPNWINSSTTYKSIKVLNPQDTFGIQAYFKGFVNLNILGGQFSNHSNSKCICLLKATSGGGLNISNVDFELLNGSVTKSGKTISNNISKLEYDEGTAISISSVRGISINGGSTYKINTNSLFKFSYDCRNVNVNGINSVGNFKYAIEFNSTSNTWLNTDLPINLLNDNALSNLSKNLKMDSPPKNGSYPTGLIIYNKNPRSKQFIGWVCVEGGSPGIWKGFGKID